MKYETEMTQLDQKQWHNGLIGKVFYHICPDNDKYYRTIRIHHNPFTNSLQPQLSNPVYGIPPDGMQAIHPLMLNRLMRQSQMNAFQ